MIHHVLVFLFVCASLLAQTIRVANHSAAPFNGWKRVTVDIMPPHEAGTVDGVTYVLGRQCGLNLRVLDIKVSLAGGETKSYDLSRATKLTWFPAPVPTDLNYHFGGQPTIGNDPMIALPPVRDGAAYSARYLGRVGRTILIDLALLWYPDKPAFATGEVFISSSNPNTPDLTEAVPPGLAIKFGDSIPLALGGGPNLLAPGLSLADGQGRCFPITFVWLRHLQSAEDWATAGATAFQQIGGVGIKSLFPDGNPQLPAGFNVRDWFNQHYGRTVSNLRTLDHPTLGPAADTGQTGAVEDQTFVGGEMFAKDPTGKEVGIGAELLNYYAALNTSGHPMHHSEYDGSIITRAKRPNLRLFYSRPHSSGSDRLGKTRDLQLIESSWWNGPDMQHWTINRLYAAARTMGTVMTQRLLEHHANNFIIQVTTTPGWATSAIWSSRELGWYGISVYRLWLALENRQLAEQVKNHWIEYHNKIVLPQLGSKTIWDVRLNDSRLGTGEWWMPWQQAIGCYGIDLAGKEFNHPQARAFALASAKRIMAEAYVLENGLWVEYELKAIDGRRQRSGMFTTSWMPLAIATILRNEPNNAQAIAIWNQIKIDAGNNGRWMPPEVK